MNPFSHRFMRPIALAMALTLGAIASPVASALTAGASYSVVVSRINPDGTLQALTSTSTTADANGKIQFSLSSLPSASSSVHFLLLQVKDGNGQVVRQGIAPAPSASGTNQVGINPLSHVQAEALLGSMQSNHTDDPLAAAFGLVFVRSANLAASDIGGLGQMMATAIRGTGGLEDFLRQHGVSTAALATFKDRIIDNPTSGSKDLSDYVAYFKHAVDNGSNDDLAIAGGLMADIMVDAAAAAGIDQQVLLAAFDAAGSAPGLQAAMGSLSSSFQGAVQAAVSGFETRLSSMVLKKTYSDALATLGGNQALIARFNAGVQAFVQAQQALDTQYGQYFMDPQGYLASHPGQTEQQIQQAIDTAFQSAWTQFQADIRSKNAEIQTMLTAVANATGMTTSQLQGVGQERDANGNMVNWPIPQTVAVTWVANILNAGGSLSFTRDTTPVPAPMQQWLDSDDNPSNGIDGQRHDFTTQMPASFAALMGLMEDVQIVEETRRAIWANNQQPSAAQQEQARVNFANGLAHLASLIGGTTDGTTPISPAQKKALIVLMQQPNLH